MCQVEIFRVLGNKWCRLSSDKYFMWVSNKRRCEDFNSWLLFWKYYITI